MAETGPPLLFSTSVSGAQRAGVHQDVLTQGVGVTCGECHRYTGREGHLVGEKGKMYEPFVLRESQKKQINKNKACGLNPADLDLSEDALVKFIQVLDVPNQEGAIYRVDGEQHVWTLVPLCGQNLHLPLQQH